MGRLIRLEITIIVVQKLKNGVRINSYSVP